MSPFDVAWGLLKSYTSSAATPDGKIVPSFMEKYKEKSQYFDGRSADSPSVKRFKPPLPIAMRQKPPLPPDESRQFIFEDRPTPEDALGEVGHAANFSTAEMLDEHAKKFGTDVLYADTGMVPGDSRFTSYGQ